jgi:hypothetical protein
MGTGSFVASSFEVRRALGRGNRAPLMRDNDRDYDIVLAMLGNREKVLLCSIIPLVVCISL